MAKIQKFFIELFCNLRCTKLYLSKITKMDIQTEKAKDGQKVGRPKKEAAEGRVKYSTALQPYLVKWLKTYAAETEQTPADVLELAVTSMRFEKERLKKMNQ